MPFLFTHAEHHARAMLLGMEYDWRDGTYCKRLDTMVYAYFDAETIEPMTVEQCLARMKSWGIDGYNEHQGRNPKPTPYCRE